MTDGAQGPQAALEPKGGMKRLTKILIAIVAVPLVLAVVFGVYLVMHLQGVIEPFDIGNADAKSRC